jgi:hypothetical protein
MGCARHRSAGMVAGYGVACRREVRWVAGPPGATEEGVEPTPPELGATTGSPHELIAEGREELPGLPRPA